MNSQIKQWSQFPYLTFDLYEIEYLIDFKASFGILLVFSFEEFVLFTDGRYIEYALELFLKNQVCQINSSANLLSTLKPYLQSEETIFVNTASLSYFQGKQLEKYFTETPIQWLRNGISSLRSIKTPKEIKKLTYAHQINSIGFFYLLEWIKLGVSEVELKTKLKEFYLAHNAIESFDCIIVFGKNTAKPHAQSQQNCKLKLNEPILIDIGCCINGYHSDMTRMIWFGDHVDDQFQEDFNLIHRIQLTVIEKIKEFDETWQLDEWVRNQFQESGVLEYYLHSLGHGIGLEIHESPSLNYQIKNIALEKGLVFTIEPGIYRSKQHGIRIEDTIVLDPKTGNPVVLTQNVPKNLLLLPK